jgi:hypothetical protein
MSPGQWELEVICCKNSFLGLLAKACWPVFMTAVIFDANLCLQSCEGFYKEPDRGVLLVNSPSDKKVTREK